jgi:glycosyltransferase involved in cell wall biosynthesis
VLVDDGSGDATRALLRAIQQRFGDWVKVVELSVNVGAACARNAGWRVATQIYIAFLDADDAWHPRKIEIQCDYMLAHPGVALCGHLHRHVNADTNPTSWWATQSVNESQPVTLTGLLLRNAFVTPSVMLKREISMRFTEGERHMEDQRLWLDIVGAPLPTVKLMVDLVAIYKPAYGVSGLSADMWRMEKAELANYRYVYRGRKISCLSMRLLQAYSLVKYVRRLVTVYFLRRN